MIDKQDALAMLRQATDDNTASFREGQWEAIDKIVNHRQKLFVVERTGWGKSTVYFIATRFLRNRGGGPTLIISPLLALIRNQIDAAQRLAIRAASINSANTDEWGAIRNRIEHDEVDVILISPERLANDEFIENYLTPVAEHVSLLVVDEAHCISDWGHDFRPDYRRLVHVLQRMPATMRILCTTATANDRVIDDVIEQLGELSIQRGSLMRETIYLHTMRLKTQAERLAWLAENIESLPGTGIIYTLTVRDAIQVSNWLQDRSINALAYYSGITSEDCEDSNLYRQKLEKLLAANRVKALVATVALGMGYDKPDLGFVIHYQAPSSIVAYYQQVGRAGRAIDQAFGVLMSGVEDEEIHEHFRTSAFPSSEFVERVLELTEAHDGVPISEVEKVLNWKKTQIEQVFQFLSVENPAPVIKKSSKWYRTVNPYQLDHDRILRIISKRKLEWSEVQDYIDEQGCLMAFLANSLNQRNIQPCGKCTNCSGKPVVNTAISERSINAANLFLRHSEIHLECRKKVPANALKEYEFEGKLPLGLRAETGRVLARWDNVGWGRMVTEGKQRGRFRGELVDTAVEMYHNWSPSPEPEWVTSVPSARRPELVLNFVKRLSCSLNLPYKPVVINVKSHEPQKLQENSFHQCSNLDGVFSIEGDVPDTPVLLVDDIVDSRWTLTIVAALLREAGSGPVFPLTLATTNPRM